MELRSLDDDTRTVMVDELDADLANGSLYLSPRLAIEMVTWADMLRDAFRTGTPETLAKALRYPGRLNNWEMKNRAGKQYSSAVPINAADTLAEGEFNRFYIRAVCIRALAEGKAVEVYRAKEVPSPRAESQMRLGQRADATALLQDLRDHPGIDTALGLPSGPNSGLSVLLV